MTATDPKNQDDSSKDEKRSKFEQAADSQMNKMSTTELKEDETLTGEGVQSALGALKSLKERKVGRAREKDIEFVIKELDLSRKQAQKLLACHSFNLVAAVEQYIKS
ncbi:hypothetical protein ACOME3_008429 [Neoechinorhynchus agilis]